MVERLADVKPCPICGGQPYIGQEDDYRRGIVVPDSFIIGCEDDEHSVDTGHWATREEAVRRWNRRRDA